MCASSGSIFRWDLSDGKLENQQEISFNNSTPISHIAALSTKLCFVAFTNGDILLSDITSGRILHNFRNEDAALQQLQTDGQILVALGGGIVKFWIFDQDQNTVGAAWVLSE